MNRSKAAALLLGTLAFAWALALFFGFPFLYGKKVEALRGQSEATVRAELGPPTRTWDSAGFSCDLGFPCTIAKVQPGPVWMYSDGHQAWYLYFDGSARLVDLEAVRPGGEDAGEIIKLPLR